MFSGPRSIFPINFIEKPYVGGSQAISKMNKAITLIPLIVSSLKLHSRVTPCWERGGVLGTQTYSLSRREIEILKSRSIKMMLKHFSHSAEAVT